jgi:GT2 family glycosyltransferase
MQTMADQPLSIVIPTWNQVEFTAACVASLRANTDVEYELIVVDNGSEPAQAATAEELADTFIGNRTNLGFAPAMNQGLRAATGTYVAFANNDTVFPESWASRLINTCETLSPSGLVLPAVTAAGNQASVRTEPADRISVFPPFAAIPSGVVYVVARHTILDLGGWNEQYGTASAEDLDLLFTYWANGRSVVLDERVLVHHESAVTASTLPNRNALYKANRLAFAARWAEADTATIPRLTSCPDDEFAANLAQARIAGTWMQQWFRAKDLADERARAARTAEANPAANTDKLPSFVSRVVRSFRGR